MKMWSESASEKKIANQEIGVPRETALAAWRKLRRRIGGREAPPLRGL